MFNPKRQEFIDYDLLQQMINDRRFAGRTPSDKIKSNECIEVAIKRVLDHTDEEQIYYKGCGRNELCHRDYNSNGAQHLPRDIRSLVTEDYYSIDCDSCHSACMIMLCRALNIKVPPILIEAVEKKNEIRTHVAETHEVTIGEAKIMINSCLYGKKLKDCKSEWLDIYSKTIRKLVPSIVSPADVKVVKARFALKQQTWKDSNLSVISERLARAEWQVVYHTQKFLET